MEFTLNILQRIHDNPAMPLTQAVPESYAETLLKYHGFIASSAFYVSKNHRMESCVPYSNCQR
jgi:hypothetical protein